eukprot:CAMPEP_0113474544 /NCGR_PEP_ID=MMETSP0014_2-20120614/18643_1 /TAXON_ID=2857 /ORGANISM="Nitzschia sp." /LENGTH=411 /DNA_ID=CAMNT_0000367403 /DNA_START=364 /DNA_END=1595 /DNA_ORIENTATION=- /assembly_acc=CAM_ASM_000159
MKLVVQYVIAALCLCMSPSMAATDCRAQRSTVEAAGDGSVTFNDMDPLGGANNIDKIVEIEVFAGNFALNFVVSKLCTTYRTVDGNTQSVCNGNGGTSQGRVVIPDGAYLERVETLVGKYVDWVSFTLTNGDKFGPWGGKTGIGANGNYSNGEGVVLAFYGKDGSVMDRIIPIFRVNEMHSVQLKNIDYSEVFAPRVNDFNFDSPDMVRRNDNRLGSVERTTFLELTTTKEATETTTVTESQEFSIGLEITASTGYDVGFSSGDIETSFSIGGAFTASKENPTTISETVTIGDTIEVKAPAGVMVIAELFVRTVDFEYEWEGPAVCTYTYAPTTEIVDEQATFSGKTFGSRPFEEWTVLYREVAGDTAPSEAPTNAPSLRASGLLTPATSPTDESAAAPRANMLILTTMIV